MCRQPHQKSGRKQPRSNRRTPPATEATAAALLAAGARRDTRGRCGRGGRGDTALPEQGVGTARSRRDWFVKPKRRWGFACFLGIVLSAVT